MCVKTFLLSLLFAALTANVSAQDIKTAYNLSKISSFIAVSHVGYETANELRDSLVSLRNRYNSVDFVIDLTNAKGNTLIAPEILADTLDGCFQRCAFLVGPHTERGALNIAKEMRLQKKGVVLGDIPEDETMVDVQLKAYDEYRTQWYDSLHAANVIEKSAERFVDERKDQLCSKYPTSKALYLNFDKNAEFLDVLNAVAAENGIKQNDEAFYYSGFVLFAEARAEIMKVMFPDEPTEYYRALNLSMETAIKAAQDIIESGEYRKILK